MMTLLSNYSPLHANLLEIVEAVHDRSFCGRKLGKNIQQLQHNVLMVVDDGQMQSTRQRSQPEGTQ